MKDDDRFRVFPVLMKVDKAASLIRKAELGQSLAHCWAGRERVIRRIAPAGVAGRHGDENSVVIRQAAFLELLVSRRHLLLCSCETWTEQAKNDDGEDVPFSKSAALEFLTKLPDCLFDGVRAFAGDEANFLSDEEPSDGDMEETAGN